MPVGKRLHQLAASIDRLAAMDLQFGARYVVVNIPSTVAETVEGDHVVRRYVVVVGKTDRPSPTLSTMITTVNLNPTWTIPLSIAKKDIITKMRKDPGYLARMHIRPLDAQGNEIDPATIDWNSDRSPNFTLRQDSGTWNALGAVRIDMPNPYSVYMHDTSHKNLFGNDYRFESSGCTRVAEVRDLRPGCCATIRAGARRDRCRHREGPAPGRPPHPQGSGGLDLSDRLGDPRRHRPFPRRHLWARRQAAHPLTAEAHAPNALVAARASGFVLQSADTKPFEVKSVSYLDSQ